VSDVGDECTRRIGIFYEGVMTKGLSTISGDSAVQANKNASVGNRGTTKEGVENAS